MKNIALGVHLQGLNRQSYAPALLGLLDTYTGSVAAYGLPSLSNATTNVVRVRRASDNAEQDFTATQVTDGTMTTFCAATDGYVTTWYDQSGNGNDATQATAANQPKIVSFGSIITNNGYQVIQYDSSNDNLGTSFTATGTMLMGGSDGGAFYEVAISGAYNLLADASFTEHPIRESIRVVWGRSLSATEKTEIEALVTYSDWDFSDVSNFNSYWRSRSTLTSFPAIDTSSGTNFGSSWKGCSSLTSFPSIDTSAGTDFNSAWDSCTSLTSFPSLDLSSGTNFTSSWYRCTMLTSFPSLNLSNGTSFGNAWYQCYSLTSFPALNLSSGTNFGSTWSSCTGLTSFPLVDVSSGTTFIFTWYNCRNITSFPALNLSNGTIFRSAWRNCVALSSFPANMFDSVTATDFGDAFRSTNLSQTSIDNILVSINTAGTSGGTFYQSGGSAPSTTGETAINGLRSRGWSVTVTGGY